MHKKGIVVAALFMATAFLHAGKHTGLGPEISFDFGARTFEEAAALYEDLLGALGDEYELKEMYPRSGGSFVHKTERRTYLDSTYRLDGQDLAVILDFYACQKSPFPYIRKFSVQGSISFSEFFVLVDKHPAAYYAFQRDVMLKIMAFAEKKDICIKSFERTNFIFNSGPLPFPGAKVHFDFSGYSHEEALKIYYELENTLSHKYMLIYKDKNLKGYDVCLFSNGWNLKSIMLGFSTENDKQEDDAYLYLILFKDHYETPANIQAAYNDFQKGMLLATKAFAEKNNIKITDYSAGESDVDMGFMSATAE